MPEFGLLGRTLVYSFSQGYFEKKFKTEGITDASYKNYELESISKLQTLLSTHPQLKGLNVTIPYKESVLDYLDEKDTIVEAIGACNCIKINEGKLTGYNTDVTGFKTSLEPYLQPYHTCALILGTGGASKAVRYALQQLNISYTIVSRRKTGAICGYEDVGEEMLQKNKLIINTTPLGTFPDIDDDPPIPYDFLGIEHLLFDLVYNPPKSKFLQEGEKRGATIVNGYQMLVLQAEESWKIWNMD